MTRKSKFVYPNNVANLSNSIENKITVARVTDIILNSAHQEWNNYGGFNGIGTIFWEENNKQGTTYKNAAKPFYPQMSAYPLINELVLLISLPNKNMGSNQSSESYYYINTINIWNSNHHNAYPNPTLPNTLVSQQKDYNITTSGSPIRRIDDDGTGIRFNSDRNDSQKTFIEKDNIHPLYPFVGDILHQGRWGNSLRFGSTAKPFNNQIPTLNNWSESGENGSPITILRNGQPPNSVDENNQPIPGFVNIVENINSDLSSIYMTSTQQIPIITNPVEVNGTRYFSYTPSLKEIPTSPSSYTGDQVIINSGRLLFNSKSDHILLSSKRTISFEAVKGFNFDTPANFVVNVGTHIKLGGKEATEPIVLGESLRFQLENLCTNLKQLVGILKFQQSWPGGGAVPDNQLSIVASSVETSLDQILKQVTKDENDNCPILSNISKTL